MPTPPLRYGSWQGLAATGMTWEQLHALGLTWEELLYASAPPTVRGTVVGGASAVQILVGGAGRPAIAAGRRAARTAAKPAPGTPLDGAHPLAASCLAYWPFSEGTGTTAYEAAGGRDAVFGAGFSWVTHEGAPAGQFTDLDTQAATGSGAAGLALAGSPYTIICRFHVTSPYNDNFFVQFGSTNAQRQVLHVGTDAADHLMWHQWDDDYDTGVLPIGTLTGVTREVAVVMDAAHQGALYVDGALQGTHAFGGLFAGTSTWTLGGAPTNPFFYYFGRIVHLAVFDAALTATQVATFYGDPYALFAAAVPEPEPLRGPLTGGASRVGALVGGGSR